MRKIGITGGKATGKTTALKYIEEKGYCTINVEECVKEALDDTETLKKLSKIRPSIPKPSHTIAQKIEIELNFSESNPAKEFLVSILKKSLDKKVLKHSLLGKATVFVEVPFLYECPLEDFFDSVLVVKCGPKTQEERIAQAHHSSEIPELVSRSQIPLADKRRKCSEVIDNNRTLEDTFRQIDLVLEPENNLSRMFFFALIFFFLSIFLSFLFSSRCRSLFRDNLPLVHKHLSIYYANVSNKAQQCIASLRKLLYGVLFIF